MKDKFYLKSKEKQDISVLYTMLSLQGRNVTSGPPIDSKQVV